MVPWPLGPSRAAGVVDGVRLADLITRLLGPVGGVPFSNPTAGKRAAAADGAKGHAEAKPRSRSSRTSKPAAA